MAVSLRPPGAPVALSSPYPGRLADDQLLRLSGHELYWLPVPQYEATVWNIVFPVTFGELAIMLWLLIKGARPQPLNAPTSSSAAVLGCITGV
jgi:hypothetical protein